MSGEKFESSFGLENHGIRNVSGAYWNLATPALVEEVIKRREGYLSHLGPLVVATGHHTGRSPNDRFVVRQGESAKNIWWGKVNKEFSTENFDRLYSKLLAFLQGKDIFVQDCYAGADPAYRLKVRVITTQAWHSHFARNMFVQAPRQELGDFVPEFTVINAPRFHADPEVDGTRSEAFIIVNFEKKVVIIGGTSYAGEIKKSIFSVLNYLLPRRGVLSMHCSANLGKGGDVALFFGLSGTGKTTLSADPGRALIGDDEHGWSDNGIFNFEGGCYAKVIKLSASAEPEIYETTRRFGTVLENVAMDYATRRIDLDDDSLTENTRASYPLTHIPNIVRSGMAGHPTNIIMLTADAFGVMPPIARLTPEQAMYHFISGYTAKLAGTERGVTEPQPAFSSCFGAPFMALHPSVYGNLLKDKIRRHHVSCWLVNTGWTGGPYGVGSRMKIQYTRAMINAAISGRLVGVEYETDPVFGLHLPKSCPDVPAEVLNPRNTWADKEAYDRQAVELARAFRRNFVDYADAVSDSVCAAGPPAG